MSQSLNFEVTFEVPAKIIFAALTEPMEVMKYTRAPCQVEPMVGGKYVILEGRISGTFLEFDAGKKQAKMTWKMQDWKSESTVVFSFIDRDDECTITINQTDIPKGIDIENLRKGWMAQIFQPMSTICGYPIDD